MTKKYKFSMVFVAAVIAVLLAGTALAVGYPYMMEYFSRGQIQPLDGTSNLIQTDFGTQEADDTPVRIVVEEAIFDGKTAIVQLLVSPSNPQEHALLNMGLQDYPESVYDLEVTTVGTGTNTRVLGRKDGKRIINYSFSLRQADEDAAYLFKMDTLDAEELENGSVRVWLEGKVTEGISDTLELIVSGGYDFMDDYLKNGDALYDYRYSMELILNNPNRTITAKLTPVDNTGGERFEILSAWLEYNPLSGQLTVEYAYDPDLNAEPMGIDFRLYDAGGNKTAVGSGSETYLGTRADGWELLRLHNEVQSFERFPETMYLEAKVIGEEKTLGQIKCTVMEAEAIEWVLDEQEAVREENRPSYLELEPIGSWTGKKICLLGGRLRTGRKVELAFTYNGNPQDLSAVTVAYKWQDGSSFGTAQSSIRTIDGNSVFLDEVLDGNMWPNNMILEFIHNGEVLDSFECTPVSVWTEE